MLNCKLSGRTKSGSTLTVGIVQVQGSRKAAPSGGKRKLLCNFLWGIRQCEACELVSEQWLVGVCTGVPPDVTKPLQRHGFVENEAIAAMQARCRKIF